MCFKLIERYPSLISLPIDQFKKSILIVMYEQKSDYITTLYNCIFTYKHILYEL